MHYGNEDSAGERLNPALPGVCRGPGDPDTGTKVFTPDQSGRRGWKLVVDTRYSSSLHAKHFERFLGNPREKFRASYSKMAHL